MLAVDRNKFIGFFYKGAIIIFILNGILLFVVKVENEVLLTLLTALLFSFLVIGKMAENNSRKTFGYWKFLGEFKSSTIYRN